MSAFNTLLLATSCVLLLAACSSPSAVRPAPEQASAPVHSAINFTGSWELDYGRSDDVDRRLRSMYNEYRRMAARRAQSGGGEMGGRGSNSDALASNALSAVVPLARLADFITTSQVLNIEHTATDILIEREDTFALGCSFHGDTPAPVVAALGSEICGWDAHQLVFVISLPDGVRIQHRMTLAPDAQKLHIASTVRRGKSGPSFTLQRVYYRFDPLPPDYSCEYTLSKGNVCSRTAS